MQIDIASYSELMIRQRVERLEGDHWLRNGQSVHGNDAPGR